MKRRRLLLPMERLFTTTAPAPPSRGPSLSLTCKKAGGRNRRSPHGPGNGPISSRLCPRTDLTLSFPPIVRLYRGVNHWMDTGIARLSHIVVETSGGWTRKMVSSGNLTGFRISSTAVHRSFLRQSQPMAASTSCAPLPTPAGSIFTGRHGAMDNSGSPNLSPSALRAILGTWIP